MGWEGTEGVEAPKTERKTWHITTKRLEKGPELALINGRWHSDPTDLGLCSLAVADSTSADLLAHSIARFDDLN